MPDYRIGKLRHRISIVAPDEAIGRDPATGEPVTTWSVLADGVPAGYEPSATEGESAGKTTDVVTGVFTIRFMTGVNARCRVVHAGRTYEIDGEPVDVDGRRRFLTFRAVVTK